MKKVKSKESQVPQGMYLFFNAVEDEKPDFIFFSDEETYNQVVDLYLRTREKKMKLDDR